MNVIAARRAREHPDQYSPRLYVDVITVGRALEGRREM